MPLSQTKGSVRLKVRLTPSAGRNEIKGVAARADHGRCVNVRVTAVPEKGKANQQLIKLIAKSAGLPASTISVVAGETGRNKVLEFAGEEREIAQQLHTWLGTLRHE